MKERPNNFVAPWADPRPRVEIVEAARELPAMPQTVLLPRAGYEDRARGFGIATLPLAASVGIVVALVAVVGWRVPVASLITLLLALGGFAGTWLIAYLAHVFVSPDGATFLHVILAWRYLRREQRERHNRYREVRQ